MYLTFSAVAEQKLPSMVDYRPNRANHANYPSVLVSLRYLEYLQSTCTQSTSVRNITLTTSCHVQLSTHTHTHTQSNLLHQTWRVGRIHYIWTQGIADSRVAILTHVHGTADLSDATIACKHAPSISACSSTSSEALNRNSYHPYSSAFKPRIH